MFRDLSKVANYSFYFRRCETGRIESVVANWNGGGDIMRTPLRRQSVGGEKQPILKPPLY
jgi:hypothetical protein